MKVLLFGSNGFLGQSIAKEFGGRGRPVTKGVFRPGNIVQDLEQVERLLVADAPDIIVNAGASQTASDDANALNDLITSNVLFPASLCALMQKHAPKSIFVNFGTSWQIGDDGKSSPFNAYAASKSAVEPFLDHFALAGLRIATLRLYDTYGPNDKRRKVANLVCDAVILRQELGMSACEQVVDLVHIQDVLSAIEATLDHLVGLSEGRHCVFSVRSGKPVEVKEMVSIICEAAEVDVAGIVKFGVLPYRARERFHLYEKTLQPPGWAPQVTLSAGLRTLYESRALGSNSK
jgi:nucleoside-diphosphate-sugar epimerase